MKQKKALFDPYGLRLRFTLFIIISAAFCICLFWVLDEASEYVVDQYLQESTKEQTFLEKQVKSLQNFVEKNEISTENVEKIKEWEQKHLVLLLEIYANEQCIYNSFSEYMEEFPEMENNHIQQEHRIELKLQDQNVTAFLLVDHSFPYYIACVVSSLVIALLVFIALFTWFTSRIVRYICRLNEEVHILAGGNLDYEVSVRGNDEITDLAQSMNSMRLAFQQQIEVEQKLYQSSRQLVTELSHDLRTPLTCIMVYLEVLRSDPTLSQAEMEEYLKKIDRKARHMKLISDHLFEYSIDKPLGRSYDHKEPMEVQAVFAPAVETLKEDLTMRGFQVETDLDWPYVFVQVNQEFVSRIFENLYSNLCKYAAKGEPVRIDVLDAGEYFGISVMNVIAEDVEQVESNGIGLESIRTMMSHMRGSCTLEQSDGLFICTLLFPKF